MAHWIQERLAQRREVKELEAIWIMSMTAEEKQRLIGQLFCDHQEAERELALLQTSAWRMAQTFQQLAEYLLQVAQRNYVFTSQPNFTDVNVEAAYALAAEIAKARQRADDLAQRKAALGI